MQSHKRLGAPDQFSRGTRSLRTLTEKRTMRALIALLTLALLAGCGQEFDGPDHGYGPGYDFAFADGTRFRNDPPGTAFTEAQAEHHVAEAYREVEACAQIHAPGPLVVAVPNGTLDGHGGMTYPHDALIVVTDNSAQDAWDLIDGHSLSVLRHEMIHHLLGASGFPDDANAGHRSPLFLACSGEPGVLG